MNDVVYKPIFFSPGWLFEKYYGWNCIHEETGVRVIRKNFGLLAKTLIMCQGIDDIKLSCLTSDRRFSDAMGVKIIHDFSRSPGESELILGGRRFERVTDDRILNVGSFVIDLSKSEDEIWKNLAQNTRTKIRKARSNGVSSRVSVMDCEEDLDAFFSFYAPLAARVGLDSPNRATIEKIIAAGDLVTVSALNAERAVTAVNLIYLCPPYAFDIYGASADNLTSGTGQYLRWECTRWVKERGLKWYDLGGVATTDASNSIYAFKKTLGGKYVDLGSEYRRIGPAVALPYALFRQAKKFAHRCKRLL